MSRELKTLESLTQLASARVLRGILAVFFLVMVAACSAPPAGHPQGEPWDPYEDTNRAFHSFNKGLDRAIVRPVAYTYSGIVGDEVEDSISRFSNNISMPRAIVNNVLQGNMKGATEDMYRFIVNSTVGFFGLFDVATDLNMPAATDADFGQTLAVWGVREGAYIELPVFGPSTERDTVGMIVDIFMNPLDYWIRDPEEYYVFGTGISATLTNRERLGQTIDGILYESADSYAQARSLYLQNRRFKVGDSGSAGYLDPYDDPNLATE